MAKKLADQVAVAAAGGSITIEEVSKKETPEGVEARSVSTRIRTVEDLLRHIDADMDRFEVAASEATKWEGLTADRETGHPVVTELHRVHVRLKPRGGPTTRACVEAMIQANCLPLATRICRLAARLHFSATCSITIRPLAPPPAARHWSGTGGCRR